MKYLIFISIVLWTVLIGCNKEHSCQDLEMKEAHSGICSADVDYVCGCDGVSYSNPCKAAANGMEVAYAGSCN